MTFVQPNGFAREDCGVSLHKVSGLCRPRSVVHTTPEYKGIIRINVRDLVD
jgi:hypothetical protein